MKPANYPTAPALELATHPARSSRGWMPVHVTLVRTLDVSHWRSRAAHGFTWNRDGRNTGRTQ